MKKTAYFLILFTNILTLAYATEPDHNRQAPATTEVTVPEILDSKQREHPNKSPSFASLIATEGSSDSCPSTPITPRASSLCQEESITPQGKGRSLKVFLEESKNSANSK